MKKMNKKGFTIVELVIVIAVIAILAAVMIPTFSSIIEKAQMSAAIQEARTYYTELYADDIQDGAIDGKKDGTNAVSIKTGVTYEYADGAVTKFEYPADNGYTAKLNISTNDWTAAK